MTSKTKPILTQGKKNKENETAISLTRRPSRSYIQVVGLVLKTVVGTRGEYTNQHVYENTQLLVANIKLMEFIYYRIF